MKRRLKIEEMGDPWRRRTMAAIRLKGKWLQAAGFAPGNHVQLTILDAGVIELRAVNNCSPSIFEPATNQYESD